MPDAKRIVINTSPLIALVAATGDLTTFCPFERIVGNGQYWYFATSETTGRTIVMKDAIEPMQTQSIRLSQAVVDFALKQAGEL